ncbi:MAG TPA: PAS domain S-box protein [Geomonas sp.]|nr:PAS domain S-box protein [Geomonas sp.]
MTRKKDVQTEKFDLELLAESEQRFRDLVENTSDWVWEVDGECRYVYASPKVVDLLGYTPQEVLGKTPFDFMPAEEALRLKPGMQDLIKHPRPFQGLENVNIHKNGSLRVLETSGVPIQAPDGRLVGMRGIDRDITARKESEQEIRRLNEALTERAAELEAANEELQAFNYTVAHDLRQPLNLLSTYSQLIETMFGDQLPAECLRYLAEQGQVVMRMNQLIEELLRFSRFAHIELHREPVDLSTLAQEVSLSFRMTEPKRKVEFVIKPGMVADCDASLMRIVISNLLGNAWKYTSLQETAVIEFGEQELAGVRTFLVRDNGVGFDMDDARKLFTPFQRLPNTERYRGFGIGLATVDRVIRRHGGRVWAEGELDKGACIYFTIG